MIGEILFPAMILVALFGGLAAMTLDRRSRLCLMVAFGASSVFSVLGIVTALEVLTTGELQVAIPVSSTIGPLSFGLGFAVDGLSAFFLLAVSILAVPVSLYSLGYVKEYEGKYSLGRFGLLFNLFLLSMVLVVTSANVIVFLIFWELMSLTSYFLVVFEAKEEGKPAAGLLYLVMTHIGTAFIMTALALMASEAGSFDFAALAGVGGEMPSLLRSLSFIFLMLGLGMKAGIVPLHVWLPSAHPAAPSNVSALMSGVMIKTAIYMLIRTYFDFLGIHGSADAWVGLLFLIVASITALVGVLYSLAERDLKKALAYSSVENVGIILIAFGAAIVFDGYGLRDLAALALIAVLLHILFHSMFKGLLFLGSGAVLHATGTRDLEQLGGLAKRMKWTSVFFLFGVMALIAIPPFNGFVSEWLIFQSLFLSFNFNDVLINLLVAVALAVLALTGALAAASFVRVFGMTFLARPRSDNAERAREVPRSMLVGMGLLAALCLLSGVLAPAYISGVDSITSSLVGRSIRDRLTDGLVLQTPANAFSSMSPVWIAIVALIIIPLLFVFVTLYGGETRRRAGDTWDCGTPLTSRNEYTPTGYSQPLVRVFGAVLRQRTEVGVERGSDPYLRKVSYHASIRPFFEDYLYHPIVKISVGLARKVGVIQTGSIQAYLAYVFAMLLLLLLFFR